MKVAGEPPGRKADVGFVGGGKDHIPERQARPAHRLLGLGNAPAEFGEQHREAVLFLGLGGVVGGPGPLEGFDHGGRTVRLRLPAYGVLDGEDVLALLTPDFVVGAGLKEGEGR